MTGRTFRITAAALALCILAPGLFGAAPGNEDVGRQVDEITQPPPYDWLRNGSRSAGGKGGSSGSGPSKRVERAERRSTGDRSQDCDYEPRNGGDEPAPPRDSVNLPKGSGGCDGGGTPGGDVSPPVPSEPETGGCDSPPTMDCGFEPPDCNCAPGGAGSCGGCGALGGVAGPFGVIMGALALALVIFLVARAFLGRKDKLDDSQIVVEDASAPEQIRMSQVEAIPAKTMMDRARAAASSGDYKVAVGWAYLAGISNLNRDGYAQLDQSTTNWKIVESTRRAGGPYKATGRLVRVFEELFFGERKPGMAHWTECEKIVEEELGEAPTTQS